MELARKLLSKTKSNKLNIDLENYRDTPFSSKIQRKSKLKYRETSAGAAG